MWRNCTWSTHVNRFCFQNCDSNTVEEKSRCKVGSASAERRTESSSQEGRRRTAAALRGSRWTVLNRIVAIDEIWIRDFEPQLKSQSSQWKHATSRPKKCCRQQSKVKFVMIMAPDKNGVIATDRVPPGSTVTAAYYRKFLQDVLRPKIRQKGLPYSQPVSSFCTIKRGLMPQMQYRKFWKSMDGKCFPTRRTVLTWAHQTLTCSQNWRNHSVGNASAALRKCLMRWPE